MLRRYIYNILKLNLTEMLFIAMILITFSIITFKIIIMLLLKYSTSTHNVINNKHLFINDTVLIFYIDT